MSELVQFIIIGLGVGATYVLIAQGLVLTYRGSSVVNFAQGAFAMVGAFVYYKAKSGWGCDTVEAFLISIAVTMAVSALTHLAILRRLRTASPLVRLVAVLGYFFVLLAGAELIWGDGSDPVQGPLPITVVHPFGKSIPVTEQNLWLVGIAVAVTALCWAFNRWARFGAQTEAVAESPVVASTIGISPDAVAAINWALGGALAALAGIFIAPILFLSAAGLALVVLHGLAGALFGRFRYYWSTLFAALGVGVLESLLIQYVGHTGIFKPFTNASGALLGLFSAETVSGSAAFIVILCILILGGRAIPQRSELLDRLPRIGSGSIARIPVSIGFAAVFVALLLAPDDWTGPAIVSIGYAMICLSLVVVTGYTGQLSLAQLALAGFGAWAAAQFVGAVGVPVWLGMVAGVLATVPIGLLFALPALRTRGVNLAILTFGLAVVISQLIFGNPVMTGGFNGLDIGDIRLFGIDLDGTSHPNRYAAAAWIVLGLLGLAVLNLRRGPSGRRLIAVRGNERAAASLGVSVARAKLYGFGVGSGIAAAGGIVLSFREQLANFQPYDPLGSIQVVVYSVLGGIGYVFGAVIGGTFAAGGIGSRIFEAIVHSDSWLNLIAGALLLITVLANPNGIADQLAHSGRRRPRVVTARATASASAETEPDDSDRVDLRVETPTTLTIADLSVHYGGTVALDAVSLSVTAGSLIGLMGPNGAGKTTLIDAVTGYAGHTGTVLLGDQDVSGWSADRRARAGLARTFQSLELFDDLTVRENLLIACDSYGLGQYLTDLVHPARQPLSPVALAAVRECGLGSLLDTSTEELSYGTRRLVAIARAVAAHPNVLLLDEPAAGLSTEETTELGHLVRRLAKEWGMAVLVIEHDVPFMMEFCDQIVAIDFGRKIAFGRPADIQRDTAVLASYLGG